MGNPFQSLIFSTFFRRRLSEKHSYFYWPIWGLLLQRLALFVAILYAIIPLMFMLPIFAYNPNLSITEVVKVGFALGNKKWGIAFLTLVLNGILIYVVSLVTFGLGSLFFSCFLYLPQYIIYKNVIGFESPESESQSIDL